MAAQMISIFDFDCTLTKEHTFRSTALHGLSPDGLRNHSVEQYQRGWAAQRQLAKANLTDYVKHNDDDFYLCIATYHNNPSFIAGFLSGHFGRELSYVKTDDVGESTVIASYQLMGVSRPILISCIAATDADFDNALRILSDKNHQIRQLMQVLATQCDLSSCAINFYDDTPNNALQATMVDGVRAWEVRRDVKEELVTKSPGHGAGYESFPMPVQPQALTNQADACVQEFHKRHSLRFQEESLGLLGFFRRTRLSATADLPTILQHAQRLGKRSHQIAMGMNWLDEQGRTLDTAPDCVKICRPAGS